jgi:hypothetical protein
MGGSAGEANNYFGTGGYHGAGGGRLSARDAGAEHLNPQAGSASLLNDLTYRLACE